MTSLASLAWFRPCPWDERRAMEALLEDLLRDPAFLRPGMAGPEGRCPDKLVTVKSVRWSLEGEMIKSTYARSRTMYPKLQMCIC